MSLNIDMSETLLCKEGKSSGVMELVAFSMLIVGINYIRDYRAAVEFERRVRLYAEVFGPPWAGGDEAGEYFYSIIPKLVGTRTNVSPKTKAQFDSMVRAHRRRLGSKQVSA